MTVGAEEVGEAVAVAGSDFAPDAPQRARAALNEFGWIGTTG
jgi:hypothetical protein